MHKKIVYLFILLIAAGLFIGFYAISKNPRRDNKNFDIQSAEIGVAQLNDFDRAKILAIDSEDVTQNSHLTRVVQNVKIHFLTGNVKGQDINIDFETSNLNQKLKVGDTVVVAQVPDPQNNNGSPYVIVDQYRLPYLAIICVLFLILAIVFGRLRGATSVVGLAFSIFVLTYFIAPQILQGQNPVLIGLLGAFIIAIVSIFLAHGFNERTGLAVISTLVTLGIAQGLAFGAVHFVRLLGNGSEEAYLLQAGSLGSFNLQGLLLASIIIGTLGILDDVTTGQTAAVYEIYKINSKFSFLDFYQKAMSIGKEHIASLINTLVLAYAGAFFPLFLLIVISNSQPLWVIINSEFISEEIVRTLVGSIALILAVPIATALSAYYFSRKNLAKA